VKLEIVQSREVTREPEHRREFHKVGARPGDSYFSFICAEDGTVKPFCAETVVSFERCLRGVAAGIWIESRRTLEWRRTIPARGRCVCGAEVALSGFTNACDCGRDYDMGGSLLAPREQWGEETGETAAQILMAKEGDI
jgi:hypothetical protein